jgi:predicted ArsR family transcriptional regulator
VTVLTVAGLLRSPEIEHTLVVKFEPSTDPRTRDEVARLLLEQGPATANSLGKRLDLSPAAVRRHLDTLLAEGRIEVRQQRPLGPRGRGRPAKLFALTEAGRESFPHAYDDLAAAALRFLAQTHGEDAVQAFADSRVAFLAERYGPAIAKAGSAQDRLEVLADALSTEGYAATAVDGTGQLCQHHCPVAHVAAEFPQLCEAETRAFEKLLGTHVTRLATIARGDGVCTTHLPVACRSVPTHTPVTGRKSG